MTVTAQVVIVACMRMGVAVFVASRDTGKRENKFQSLVEGK